MKEFIITAISSGITLIVTYLLTRRKNKAETELNEVTTIQKIVDIYREGFEQVKEELKEARDEISKLREEVKHLTEENSKMDCELQNLRKTILNN